MEEIWPWALQVATFSELATSWYYALHKGKLANLVWAGSASSFRRCLESTSLQLRKGWVQTCPKFMFQQLDLMNWVVLSQLQRRRIYGPGKMVKNGAMNYLLFQTMSRQLFLIIKLKIQQTLVFSWPQLHISLGRNKDCIMHYIWVNRR